MTSEPKTTESFALRPSKLTEYIGQENAVKTLRMFLQAVNNRGYASEHVLFYGPPGIGKTTLAYIIAKELSSEIKTTTGAALQKGSDLSAILTNLQENDVFFIDEIHRMPKPIEEMLYAVMEDFSLDVIIGKGPSARTVRLPIPKVTIIGATTKLALLSAPLRDRFGLLLRLNYYNDNEMAEIIKRTCQMLDVPISPGAINSIAKRSRNTPRIANRLLKRARDMFEVEGHKMIDESIVSQLFDLLEIDEAGLTDMDIRYLRLIGETFQNSPVGIETISSSLAEDKRTIEEFIEPYLLQMGFIKKTTRGRLLTYDAMKHLKIDDTQDRLV
jgi:Holliday junction DNA helicase RuvB